MNKERNVALARACYEAYVTKDRSAIEALIAADFHFTSPLDHRINRVTYFERCWPNSERIEGFHFIHMVPDGDRVFVTYEGRAVTGDGFGTPRSSPSAMASSLRSRSISDGRLRTTQRPELLSTDPKAAGP